MFEAALNLQQTALSQERKHSVFFKEVKVKVTVTGHEGPEGE